MMMTLIAYVVILSSFYLTGVLCDYYTTVRVVESGMGDEANPVFHNNLRRLLVPFIWLLPVVIVLCGLESNFLAGGSYDTTEGATFVYNADKSIPSTVSFMVFIAIVLGAHKIVASVNNYFVWRRGRGMTDIIAYVLRLNNLVLIHLVTVFVALVVVLPLAYLLRVLTFNLLF